MLLLVIAYSSFGIGIRDYKPPVSSLMDFDISAFYTYFGQDTTTTNNGSVNFDLTKFYESQPFGWSVNTGGGLTYDGMAPDSVDESQYSVSLQAEVHKYLSGDFFGYTSLNTSSQSSYDHLAAAAFIGAGYGRYTNATSMARALRIQEELIEEGTITSDLERTVMIELAAAIDNRSSYDLERDYFQAIETILESSEKIDILSAVALYRIMQVLDNEVIRDRYYGYRIGAGLGYELSNPYSEDTEDPVMEVFGNFSYPFSLRSQFNQAVNFTSNLNDFGDAYTLQSTSSYSFEVSDKIDDRVQYQVVMNKSLPDGSSESVSVTTGTLTNSFIYYIENRVGLNLDVSLIKTTDVDLQKAVGFSITYDLL